MATSIPTHVTLLPPTPVAGPDFEHFVDHLDKVAAGIAPFTMVLRGTGTFRPVSPVVFVQVSQGIAECEILEQAIRGGPLTRELDFYYHPHITVAHAIDDEALDRAFSDLADYEASFAVEGFHLYEHGQDGVWRPEREFRLRGLA